MSRFDDARSRKIIFVSSCLLNANNKVKGLGRYPGICKDVFDTLYENDLGIQQMDCPEMLYIGVQRWWHTKNLYDIRGYRKHCKRLAEKAATYMEEYERGGYKNVAVLGCDGSPTCGVSVTCYDPEWGGTPVNERFHDTLVEGQGIYIEELKQVIKEREITLPPFYGLALDDDSVNMDQIIQDFKIFIADISS